MALQRKEAENRPRLRVVESDPYEDRIDATFAAHKAEITTMFARAQAAIYVAPNKQCGCDYCIYPLTISRPRDPSRSQAGPRPVAAPRQRLPASLDPLLKGIYAKADRSGYDATGGLTRILPRSYPENWRDFQDELRKVDDQAPGPSLPRSVSWFGARAKLDLPHFLCLTCNREFVHPSEFAAHSRADLSRELDGYSRPDKTTDPRKKRLTRDEARRVAGQAEDDLKDYSEYGDERSDREKQHDVVAYQQWRRGLASTLNLPAPLARDARIRRLVACLDFQRRDSGAPEFSDYITDRIAIRLREVELWIEEEQRNRDAVDDRWMAEHLGLTAPREREAFRNHLLGTSLYTIALLMNVEVSTVKEWLKRARRQARTQKRDPWNRAERVPLHRTFKYEESQPAYERA
jgi:hypothetical protein